MFLVIMKLSVHLQAGVLLCGTGCRCHCDLHGDLHCCQFVVQFEWRVRKQVVTQSVMAGADHGLTVQTLSRLISHACLLWNAIHACRTVQLTEPITAEG